MTTNTNAALREKLIDLIAEHLSGTYHCTRVWEAWNVGTMSQDDFEDVGESDTPAELADAILAPIGADALRVAAQAALTALENLHEIDTETECITIDVRDEIEALRAALASAAQPVPAAVASPLTKLQRKAIAVCFTSDKVSVSEVQRKLSISYADAQTLCQSIVDLGLTDELELAPSLKRGAPAPHPAPVAQGDARVQGLIAAADYIDAARAQQEHKP